MSRFFAGFLTALFLIALLFGIERGLAAQRWKRVADHRGWQAEETYRFLTEPIARGKDGKNVSRADVLNVLIGQAFQQPPAPAQSAK